MAEAVGRVGKHQRRCATLLRLSAVQEEVGRVCPVNGVVIPNKSAGP